MRIEVIYETGKRLKVEVNDPNMAVLLARLNGPTRWIDANGDNSLYLNVERAVSIKEISPPT